ncbi:MAG: AzlC family ABC transporter permease [Desulfonatronovibrionaceae bacterium]
MDKKTDADSLDTFIRAFYRTLPVILGYLSVGFAYGVLAQKSGLSDFNTVFMSVIVFAGSAQLVAVGLFASGVGPATVILTTFIVNLRHLLMSAALAPYLKGWTRVQKYWFAFQLTDETFALHMRSFSQKGVYRPEVFTVNAIAQSAWIAGSALGLVAGSLVTDVKPIGLDFALPAMFAVLLVWQLDSFVKFLTATLAAVSSIAFILLGAGQLSVLLATLLAASLGLGIMQWIKR